MNRTERDHNPGFRPLELGDPIPVPAQANEQADAAVRLKSARLLQQAAERIPGFSSPPFDPRVLGKALGVPIHFTPRLGEIDALIVRRSGTFHIVANSNVTHAGRLNFTLAHELGHLFFADAERQVHLRARDRKLYDGTPEGRVLERMCDLAAAELLMPFNWFDAAAVEHGFNAAAVPRLAERFEVSLEAAALRLLGTRGHEPCAIGFFEYDVRPSVRAKGEARLEGAEYRVRRLFRTESFPFLFPRGKSVPTESVIYRSSLCRRMLDSEETFSLGNRRERLRVSAYPLHQGVVVDQPPLVCSVFDLHTDR